MRNSFTKRETRVTIEHDTCAYVDKSVDFVDYSWFYTEKTTDGSKMVYNSKRTVVDKKTKRYWISQ